MSFTRFHPENDETKDGIELGRIPNKGALRGALDAYEHGNAETFAVEHNRRGPAGYREVKQRMSETLKVFQERGVLAQREYGEEVPASVHGAPRTVEESKEVLERLRRMDNFETQDFDTVDNDIERAVNLNRDHLDYVVEESWRWAMAFFIGLSMGFCAFCVDIGLETLNSWKFGAVKKVIREHGGFWGPYVTFLAFCLTYSGISGAIVSFIAPLAAGSGIPEIKTYLNGVHIRGLLGLRTLVFKMIGVVCSMAGGLIAGKEGPFIHAGGIVGGGWAGMGSLTLTELAKGRLQFRAPRKYGGYFRRDQEHRDFVSIGTAAGVSTAFAAPVGGLLLAIEEGSSFLSLGLFWRGFLATCTGVLTLHFLAQCHANFGGILSQRFGIWRDLGLYDDNLALYGKRYFYYVWELPVFVLMGVTAGLLGALFIKLNIRMTQLRARFIPPSKPRLRLMEVLVVAWVIATVFFLVTYTAPCLKVPPAEQLKYFELGGSDQDIFSGIDDTDARGLKHFPRLWCGKDEFNPRGQLFFTPLVQAMRMIIHLGETVPEATDQLVYHISAGTLVLWTITVFCLMLLTFGIGAASGIFIPSLAVGGAWGRLIGMLVQACLRHAGSSLPVSLPAYTVVGAAAMLGGVTRMTISITVLAMEGTAALQLIVPLMFAVFVAKMVGDSLTPSIYDVHIKIRGAPVLMESGQDPRQRMVNDKLTVSEVATTALVALPPIVPLRQLVETLRSCRHAAFPVTPDIKAAYQSDTAFALHGVVSRPQLLRMLKHRIGFCSHDPRMPAPPSKNSIPASQEERLELLGKLEQLPLKVRTEEQEGLLQGLTNAELAMWLDLRPYMQRTPFVVQGNASLARAYRLFRTMGLHHLFVATPKPQVIGLITRKDVTEENAELLLGSKANRGLLLAALPRLRRSQSSLPSIPYYDSQISNSNLNAADMSGYGNALALQPVPESEDAAAEEGEHVALIGQRSLRMPRV